MRNMKQNLWAQLRHGCFLCYYWWRGKGSALVPFSEEAALAVWGRDPVFSTPKKQEHFLKLSLSFNNAYVKKTKQKTGMYKQVFYFSVDMLLFFNAIRMKMGSSAIQRKIYLISEHYLKNSSKFLLNDVYRDRIWSNKHRIRL